MEKKLVIQDTDTIKNIFIQIDTRQGKTIVYSNFSAWENLAFLMEALGVTAAVCEEEGSDKRQIYQAINRYLTKVLGSYKFVSKK